MRKITEQAANAMISNRDYNNGNTKVMSTILESDNVTMSVLYLHGNNIATLTRHPVLGDNLYMTFSGWPTATTKERLNGLCETLIGCKPFYTKDFCLYFNETAIGSRDCIAYNIQTGEVTIKKHN